MPTKVSRCRDRRGACRRRGPVRANNSETQTPLEFRPYGGGRMISLMPMVQTPNDDTDDGAAMNGGRRPTVVAAPVSTSPELSARPRRRTFTAKDKLRILADIDRATGTGATGSILRREGLYSSTLSDWRRQRDAGALGALSPGKRGPKTATPNPLTTEVILLQRTNARLAQRLARAEAIIDIQKKVAALLGMPLTSKDDAP